MIISCSTNGIVESRYPVQGVSDIAAAGFENIFLDLNMFCSAQELEKCISKGQKESGCRVADDPTQLSNCSQQIISMCHEKNLCITAAAVPSIKRSTRVSDLNDLIMEITKESVRLCRQIGCGYLIVNPLFAGIKPDDEWDVNRRFYLDIGRLASQNGVMILLQNQCRDIGGHLVRGMCSDIYKACEWVDRLNSEAGKELFGFCVDTGVCSLCGQDMREFTVSLGKRIKAVRLRDCDGHNEASLVPFTASGDGTLQTDWLGFVRGMREVGFDGHLILDIGDSARVFPPLLRPGLFTMARSVAEYFSWQLGIENRLKKYASIVLFGAGNMCRNYIKCYGQKYPPLFTCDNNKASWGKTFCGLEVKSPDELRNIPSDCGIFICNVYYREIQKQLRDMKIENGIEYFNDEYMPSFYFDRLKEV